MEKAKELKDSMIIQLFTDEKFEEIEAFRSLERLRVACQWFELPKGGGIDKTIYDSLKGRLLVSKHAERRNARKLRIIYFVSYSDDLDVEDVMKTMREALHLSRMSF